MSIYWKQSLVIGGIYWLFSLILVWYGNMAALVADWILATLLLIFLLPMNKLVPIKWVDRMIQNHPIVATMLASVGWVPYFTAVLAIVAAVAAIVFSADTNIENLEKIMTIVIGVGMVRRFVMAVVVFVVLIAVLVYGKSIAGQLDDHYNIVGSFEKEPKSKPIIMTKVEQKQNNPEVVKVETMTKKAPVKTKSVAKKAPAKAKTAAKKAPVKAKTATKKSLAKAKTATKKAPTKAKATVKKALVKAKAKVSSATQAKSVKKSVAPKKKA